MQVRRAAPWGLAILRIVTGFIFLTHGIPKLFGGISGTAGFLGDLGLPVPGLAAWTLSVLEVGGGLLLIAGVLVTPVAALFVVEMMLGIVLVHAANGWFVVGAGQGGAEFNALLIAASLALMLGGPGAFAAGTGRPALGRWPSSDPGQARAPARAKDLMNVS